jgi:hypothetical protein
MQTLPRPSWISFLTKPNAKRAAGAFAPERLHRQLTELQLYILVAIPLVGIFTNTGLFLHVSGRVDRLAERMDARFDMLMGKVVDVDNRLTRVEERMAIRP